MMVGPSGSGKSSAWRTLLKALENLEGIEGVAHVVDPKVRKKNMNLWVWKSMKSLENEVWHVFYAVKDSY